MTRVSADVRRELLIEAAIRVMVRDGVARTTTRAIVGEADMRLGAFHYCFRSKAELLEQVIRTITTHSLEPALAALERGGTLEERLLGGLREYWDHVVRFPEEHRVTYELTQYAVREPGLAEVARKQYEIYLEANTTVLDTIAASSGITWSAPVPVLARSVAALIDGMTLLYLNEGDAETAWTALELGMRHLLAHAAPEPSA